MRESHCWAWGVQQDAHPLAASHPSEERGRDSQLGAQSSHGAGLHDGGPTC